VRTEEISGETKSREIAFGRIEGIIHPLATKSQVERSGFNRRGGERQQKWGLLKGGIELERGEKGKNEDKVKSDGVSTRGKNKSGMLHNDEGEASLKEVWQLMPGKKNSLGGDVSLEGESRTPGRCPEKESLKRRPGGVSS